MNKPYPKSAQQLSSRPKLHKFVLVTTVILLTTAAVNGYFINKYENERIRGIAQRELRNLITINSIYHMEFSGVTASLGLLHHELREVLSNRDLNSRAFKAQVGTRFVTFMKLIPAFKTLRLVAADGMEVIRVNRDADQLILLPDAQLQDVSTSGTVREGLSAPPNQSFVSRVTLYKENNQINPHRLPVMSARINLSDATGNSTALFEATYALSMVYNKYKAVAHSPPNAELFIINAEGNFSMGGARFKTLEFGLERGVPNSGLADVLPDLWAALNERNSGWYHADDGLYIFNNLDQKVDFDVYRPPNDRQNSGFAIIWVPEHALYAQSPLTEPAYVGFLIVLYALLISAAVLFWRNLRAQHDLILSQASLSEQNAQLTAHQKDLQAATNAGGIGLFELNRKTGEVTCNEQFRTITGLSEHRYPRLTIDNVLPLVPANERETRRNALMMIDKPKTEEATIILPGGTQKWLKRTFSPSDDIGSPYVLTGTIIDITEAHQREAALNNAVERFELAQEYSGIGVIKVNLSKDVWELDDNARKLYDLPEDEYPTISLADVEQRFASAEATEDYAKFLLPKNNPGHEFEGTRRIITRDGAERYIQRRGKFYVAEDSSTFFLGIVQDVTQQLAVQLRLIEINDQQRKMFAIISHELRTPAAAINMLSNELEVELSTRTELNSVTRHLLSVIDDLRIAVNPEADVGLQFNPFNVHTLCEEVMQQTTGLANGAGVTVRLNKQHIDRGCDVLTSDAYRLRTIITNLIRNAIHHSEGSNIRFNVTVNADKNARQQAVLKINVEDDGQGISADLVDHIFEAFTRGDTKASGTGVGLYLVKHWTEKLGGKVSYSPSSMGGANFQLMLPLQIALTVESGVAPVEPTIPEAKAALMGKRLLLVEDDRILRRTTANLLQKHFDIELVVAGDGREAITLLEQEPADLVLTDYFMPEVDGRELIQTLRQQGWEMPIIGLTAATIGDEQAELLEAGAEAVFPKPINIDTFAQIIVQLTEMDKL